MLNKRFNTILVPLLQIAMLMRSRLREYRQTHRHRQYNSDLAIWQPGSFDATAYFDLVVGSVFRGETTCHQASDALIHAGMDIEASRELTYEIMDAVLALLVIYVPDMPVKQIHECQAHILHPGDLFITYPL